VKKSAKILGFPLKNLCMIKMNKNFQMLMENLKESIEKDKKDEFIPFMIIGTAEITNTV
jgi:hypothetical protein